MGAHLTLAEIARLLDDDRFAIAGVSPLLKDAPPCQPLLLNDITAIYAHASCGGLGDQLRRLDEAVDLRLGSRLHGHDRAGLVETE